MRYISGTRHTRNGGPYGPTERGMHLEASPELSAPEDDEENGISRAKSDAGIGERPGQ